MTRARNVKAALVAAATALVLTGCGMHPGAAAVVGDDPISGEQVDDAAAALCSANIKSSQAQGQPAPDLPARGARQGALQLLIDSELSRQFGEARGVEPDQGQVSQALASNSSTTRLLPEGRRAAFTEIIRSYAEGQLVLLEVGKRSLAESGQFSPSDDEAITEGARLRDEWAKAVDIEVDPRYGSFDRGQLSPSSGSLSIPASQRATEGEKAEPSADWVAGLPATQKCS